MNGEQTLAKRAAARALATIAIAQLLALSLWFSATAVSPQLRSLWGLTTSEEAGLTLAIQLGFVVGALVSAILNLADIVRARALFFASAVAGALANAGLLFVTSSTVSAALVLRFLTGAFLAGVYPAGLKVVAGWFEHGRGRALGLLVGALTVGSASPHLIRGIGLEWEGVIIAASLLTALSALMMLRVGDGPFEVPTQRFRWRQVAMVVRDRGVRLSTYGYLGHMWELYAMWTWTATFLLASEAASGTDYGSVAILTFAVIAIGGPGSWWAGALADRFGRTRVAGSAMAVSGACALATPAVFGAGPWLVVPLFLLWGATVVADSAQFSAMVTETARDEVRGTALTLQTASGFLLTLVTIRLAPAIADATSWQWAFPVLALGPLAGISAMVILARSPISARLAEGRG
ncbi:MAG: MFS transporter [Acidimicrobiia bacterium]|nr:MFS transporter [Acidimicrobiia bacterium]